MRFCELFCWLLLATCLSFLKNCHAASSDAASSPLSRPEEGIPKLTTKRFQVKFLKDLSEHMNKAALDYLNEFLLDLSAQAENDKHSEELLQAQQSTQLDAKVIFIKQFLDMKNPEHDTLKNFYALRNANFLRRIEKQLKEMQEMSGRDIRAVRDYHLCRQFEDDGKNETNKPGIRAHNAARLKMSQMAADPTKPGITVKMDVLKFTRTLYNNTNEYGSEIIDDYLSAIKRLFLEVIAEKPVGQSSDKLAKIIDEIDIILDIDDFYNKRQRLYSYLENNMAADFDSFKTSQTAQQDIADIFLKLREKGFDLFITFLFSNFEFLERLHEEWGLLLPVIEDLATNLDDNTKLIIDVHHTYVEFKIDSENSDKYNNYLAKVKALYDKATEILGEDAHVYELLHNGSQNVGPVTFNMIRERCRN